MTTRARSPDKIIPADLASRWELIVAEAAKRLFAKREQMKLAIGARPYQGIPVSDSEGFTRWVKIRKDPEALLAVLSENVQVEADGRALVPKELMNKILGYEWRITRGEAAQPEPAPVEGIPAPDTSTAPTGGQ